MNVLSTQHFHLKCHRRYIRLLGRKAYSISKTHPPENRILLEQNGNVYSVTGSEDFSQKKALSPKPVYIISSSIQSQASKATAPWRNLDRKTLAAAFTAAFLPKGYRETVSSNYIAFSSWQALSNFSGSICGGACLCYRHPSRTFSDINVLRHILQLYPHNASCCRWALVSPLFQQVPTRLLIESQATKSLQFTSRWPQH